MTDVIIMHLSKIKNNMVQVADLPRSLRARSPHVLSPPAAVPTAEGRGTKFREPPVQRITSGKRPELSNLMNQVLANERLDRSGQENGDFVLCTTSVFRWTEAEPKALHHDIFIFHDRMTHKIRQRMNRCELVVEFTLEPPLRRRKRRTPGRFFLAKGEFPKPTHQGGAEWQKTSMK